MLTGVLEQSMVTAFAWSSFTSILPFCNASGKGGVTFLFCSLAVWLWQHVVDLLFSLCVCHVVYRTSPLLLSPCNTM